MIANYAIKNANYATKMQIMPQKNANYATKNANHL